MNITLAPPSGSPRLGAGSRRPRRVPIPHMKENGRIQRQTALTLWERTRSRWSRILRPTGNCLSSAFAEDSDAAAVDPSAIADRSVLAADMSAVVDHSALAADMSAITDHSSFAVDPSAIADLSAFAGDPSTIADLSAFAIDFSAVADLSTFAVDDCTESNKCEILYEGAILNPAAAVGMRVPVRLLGTIATEV